MKPETYNLWEKALGDFEGVEELWKSNKFEEARSKSIEAFVSALQAIEALSRELEMPDLSIIAKNAGLEWLEFWFSKSYRPNGMVKWIRRRLKRLSDDLPPDTFRPFR